MVEGLYVRTLWSKLTVPPANSKSLKVGMERLEDQ